MPTVRIATLGVTVELTASEASIGELGKQAMDLFKEATEVDKNRPAGPAVGFGNERRWTPDHVDPNYNSNGGFRPVKA